MVNDNGIKSLAFEKTIIDLLKVNNPDGIQYYKIKEEINKYNYFRFDFYSDKGINLDFIIENCFISGRVAVEICYAVVLTSLEKIVKYAILHKANALVFFIFAKLKNEQKEKIINNYSNDIKIYIFDGNVLKNVKKLEKFFSNFNEYILENRSDNNYLEKLKEIDKNQLSFALGAGCSFDSNISGWEVLSKALGYEMIYNILDSGEAAYLNMNIANTMSEGIFSDFDKTSALDAIKNYYESQTFSNEYFKYLKKVLYMSYDQQNDTNTALMKSIRNCITKYKVKELITYNFDSVLEQSLKNDYTSTKNEIQSSTTFINDTLIYHVHGYIPFDYDGKTFISNFVFTDREYYENAIKKGNFTNTKQKYLFDNYNVIFIGISFTDSNLKEILRERIANKNAQTQLFAFFKLPKFKVKGREKKIIEEKYKILQQSYFDTLGVKIIWVNEFVEIPGMINNI